MSEKCQEKEIELLMVKVKGYISFILKIVGWNYSFSIFSLCSYWHIQLADLWSESKPKDNLI